LLYLLQNSSSDEECNKLNKLSKQLSDVRSIKDLPVKKFYKVVSFEIVETANGRCVRCRLEDDIEDVTFFIHLPKGFLKKFRRI